MGSYADGRIVMVTPKDPPHAWRKVDNVLSIVDGELGFVGIGVRNREQSKVGLERRRGAGGMGEKSPLLSVSVTPSKLANGVGGWVVRLGYVVR